MTQKMKVSTHNEYNQFSEKRGNVFHFINDAIENWYENTSKVVGGTTYKVIILIHIVVHLFGIGLRQAVGFVKGYMKQIGKNLKVISYTRALQSLTWKLSIIKLILRNIQIAVYRHKSQYI